MSLDTTSTPPPHPFTATSRLTFNERLRDRLLGPGRHWVLVSVAMYAFACALPALGPISGDHPIRGYVCLIAVNDPIIRVYQLPYWWANPAFFVAVIASVLNRHCVAAIFAVAAALLAMSFEFLHFYENGVAATMNGLMPGCLMWIASLQLLACHELWWQWRKWKRRQEYPEERAVEIEEATPSQ